MRQDTSNATIPSGKLQRSTRIFLPKAVCDAGFSLIEMLVVLGIIGVLLALILPGISYVRQRARVTDCANRLHQIGVALQTHQSLHGALPADGENGYGYGVYLLPHLEQSALYDQVSPQSAKFSNATPSQLNAGKTKLEVFLCPNFAKAKEWQLKPSGFARSSYPGNIELLGDGIDLANVLDGESMTIVAGETTDDRSWIEPNTAAVAGGPNSGPFSSRHPSGANFVLCDGSVRFITDTVDPVTFTALGTPNGGDVVGEF
ncbi:MAG: DUF1559 domain-containing protein [Planctomycetaceae bacterium]